MPATRRARTSGGPVTKGAQSTISFGSRNRVTKPSITSDSKTGKSVVNVGKSVENVKSASIEPEAGHVTSEVAIEKQAGTELAAPKSEAKEKAEKITDAQIKKYWAAREAERSSGRVHQEDLTVEEKVLRLFDISSQYGPCIGIARMKRWNRADKLGLHPPIEALAVLLKEETKGNGKIERAYVDELMGTKFVVGEVAGSA